MVEIENKNNIDIIRERYERLIEIPSEKRDAHDIFELMRLTSHFSIFSEIKMTKTHEDLCQFLQIKKLEKGEIIFKQGDEGDNYYFILNGSVDLYVLDIDQHNGKTKLNLIRNCLPGEDFGELSILYDCPRSHTAIASLESNVIYMRKKNFRKYVKDFYEKELFDFIKFFYSIPIFENQPMKNIIKFCLKSKKSKLNSYVPFIKFHDYIDEYLIIKTGIIKAYYKVKITKNFLELSHTFSEEDFIKKLEILQKFKIDQEVPWRDIIRKDFSFDNSNDKICNFNITTSPYINMKDKEKIIDNKNFSNNESKLNIINNDHLINKNSNLNLIKNLKNLKINNNKELENKENENNQNNLEDKSSHYDKDNTFNNLAKDIKEDIEKENNENILLYNNDMNYNYSNSFSKEEKAEIIQQNEIQSYQFSPKSNFNNTKNINNMEEILEENLNMESENFDKNSIDKNNRSSSNAMENLEMDQNMIIEIQNQEVLDDIEEKLKEKQEREKEILKNDMYEKETLCFSSNKEKRITRDTIYNVLIEIMEFTEKDMVCEYYASKCHKIDIYLLPTLPTEVIAIKTDEFKEISPELSSAIREYSCPVFESKRVFKKLHKTIKWIRQKKDLLGSVLPK